MASTGLAGQSLVPIIFDPYGDVTVTLLYHTNTPDPVKPAGSPATGKAPTAELSGTATQKPLTNADKDAKKIIFRASLKHLTLASPHASMVLRGQGSEATTVHTDGTRHWTITYPFDPDAFHTVLKIIHGLNRSLPRVLTLQRLAQVAFVVDDLDCEQAVHFFARSWIEHIVYPKPEILCVDLARWILVSSVFRDFETFAEVTKTAILASTGSSSYADGLPIRYQIFEIIKERRKAALDEVMFLFETTRHVLMKDDLYYTPGRTFSYSQVPCSYECQAALLGALTMFAFRLGWTQPAPPGYNYGRASVRLLVDAILAIRSPSVCRLLKPGRSKNQDISYGFGTTAPCCSVKTLLGQQLKNMVDDLAGLELQQFIPK